MKIAQILAIAVCVIAVCFPAVVCAQGEIVPGKGKRSGLMPGKRFLKSSKGLKLSLELIKCDEKIIEIEVTFKNTGSKRIQLYLYDNCSLLPFRTLDFFFEFSRGVGQIYCGRDTLIKGPRNFLQAGKLAAIKPGGCIQKTLKLHDQHALLHTGEYNLAATYRRGPYDMWPGRPIKSNTVTFCVKLATVKAKEEKEKLQKDITAFYGSTRAGKAIDTKLLASLAERGAAIKDDRTTLVFTTYLIFFLEHNSDTNTQAAIIGALESLTGMNYDKDLDKWNKWHEENRKVYVTEAQMAAIRKDIKGLIADLALKEWRGAKDAAANELINRGEAVLPGIRKALKSRRLNRGQKALLKTLRVQIEGQIEEKKKEEESAKKNDKPSTPEEKKHGDGK